MKTLIPAPKNGINKLCQFTVPDINDDIRVVEGWLINSRIIISRNRKKKMARPTAALTVVLSKIRPFRVKLVNTSAIRRSSLACASMC